MWLRPVGPADRQPQQPSPSSLYAYDPDLSHHGGIAVETEAYDPASDSWTVLEHMRAPRGGTGGAVIGDRLYVPGGARILAFAPLYAPAVTPWTRSSSPPAR